MKMIKNSSLSCKYIFIAPPDLVVIEERLLAIGLADDNELKTILDNGDAAMTCGQTSGNFDETIVNEDLNTAFAELEQIVRAFYPAMDFDHRK